MANLEHFVDANVAAQFLGCSRTHLLKLAREGQVPAHPLPTGKKGLRQTWRFRLSELRDFIEQRF